MMNGHGGNSAGFDPVVFGLINALRTGNVALDLFVVALLPTLLGVIALLTRTARPVVWRVAREAGALIVGGRFATYTRVVRVERRVRRHGSMPLDPDSRNATLHKAIALYASRSGALDDQPSAKLRLMPGGREKASGPAWRRTYGATAEHLSQYAVITAVPEDEWVDVGFFPSEDARGGKVRLMRTATDAEDDRGEGGSGGSNESSGNNNGSGSSSNNATTNDGNKGGGQRDVDTVDFVLECRGADGAARIDAFLAEALAHYIKTVEAAEEKGRHLYVRQPAGSGKSGGGAGRGDDDDDDDQNGDDDGALAGLPRFKRYKLSEEKTFESLFLPQKAKFLALLDDFLHRRGKYGVRGYPRKLGVLLHGPPGTGKTTLIKALAQRAGRNIVSLDLGKIKTNQELMDSMLSMRLRVDGLDAPVTLAMSKVVFVLEDVDAAGDAVLARRATRGKQKGQPGARRQPRPGDVDPVLKLLLLMSSATDAAQGPAGAPTGATSTIETLVDDTDDKLDLSGVLNVLDGVVDTPDRIIIITTNHPDRLDPALVRPGRIDLKLHLGYLEKPEALQMIAHFVLDTTVDLLSDLERRTLGLAWDACKKAQRGMTPAQLEQLCASCFTLDDIVHALRTDESHHLSSASSLHAPPSPAAERRRDQG